MTLDRKPCEDVLSFLLQELPPEAAERFEEHLAHCSACREELNELQQAWQALPFEMDEVEPPAELKSQVMDAILSPKAKPAKPRFTSRFAYAAAAVLLFAAGGFSVWSMNRPAAPDMALHLSIPTLPVAQYSLKAFDQTMPTAKGHCWLMRQGEGSALVLQASGLKPTTGEQAYQLWIVKDGKRLNGGTFRVDNDGNGLLMYGMSPHETSFDAIGITLEPDSLGSAPRGKKVLGT